MKTLNIVNTLLLALTLTTEIDAARKPSNSVLLSDVQSLTLRKGLRTSHRRVSSVPQLKCVGGNAKGLFDADVMRCRNQGADYEDEDIQWTCTASLPPEFKLGSTDVICEGYESSSDPYVLKGSCGVEYRLILTPSGETKYGGRGSTLFGEEGAKGWSTSTILFWALFISVVGLMVYRAYYSNRMPQTPGRELPRSPFGWVGGNDGGGPPGPPPPYDSSKPSGKGHDSKAQTAWKPGFWSGLLGGAAGGYLAGGNRGGLAPPPANRGGNGEGSSRRSRSPESSSARTSSRYESTGFGSTTRR